MKRKIYKKQSGILTEGLQTLNKMINFNALHNVTNPHQGKTKKVLCVCSAGLLRSPTAARVLADKFNLNTRAAGINKEYALIPVTYILCAWADEIVTMEEWMADALPEGFNDKVVCLNVPDRFPYMNEELQELIVANYTRYLNELK